MISRGGLQAAAPATIRHDGFQHGISVELTPLGARALLGLPAGELAYVVVDLEDGLGRSSTGLVDRLVSSPDWRGRFSVLDDVLVQRLKEGCGPPPKVAWAWRHLLSTGGAVEVGALASDVGYSRRRPGRPRSMLRVWEPPLLLRRFGQRCAVGTPKA